MASGRWAEAERSLRRTLESRTGDEEVRRRLPDIEEDLKVCAYRAQAGTPQPSDLFGPWATHLDASRGRVILEFPEGPAPPLWEGSLRETAVLKLRFEREVVLEFDGKPGTAGIGLLFSFDPERRTGYVLTPGLYKRDLKYAYEQEVSVVRLDGGDGKKDLVRRTGFPACDVPWRIRGTRTSSSVSFSVKGGTSASASDSRHKAGYLGIRAESASALRITGFVEAVQFRSLLGAWHEKGFRRWVEGSWDRDAALPAWLLRGPAPAAAGAGPRFPSDEPDPPCPEAVAALDMWRKRRIPEFQVLAVRAKGASPGTRRYLDGLALLAKGRRAEAAACLDALLAREPGFSPALVYRGLARLGTRDLEGARRDLEAAREGAGGIDDLWIGLATLALLEGDLDRAVAAVRDGRAAGVGGDAFEVLEARVQRSRRGPPWARRFERTGRAGVVCSDHSVELCGEVAKSLDFSIALYAGLFPGSARPRGPVRTFVFSSREGFLNYAGDVGRKLDAAAGAYVPAVRELVLFVPEIERQVLWDTVRHEGFHAFLHDLVEEPPPWFDEGWAQCMERGKVEYGAFRMVPLEPGAVAALRGRRIVLESFLRLDHAAFMADPAVHYPAAQAFVTWLHSGEKGRRRPLLAGYFEDLRAGRSPDQAFEARFRPLLGEIEEAFNAWVAAGTPLPAR
jgi:hypothetical protein